MGKFSVRVVMMFALQFSVFFTKKLISFCNLLIVQNFVYRIYLFALGCWFLLFFVVILW